MQSAVYRELNWAQIYAIILRDVSRTLTIYKFSV